jgi:DNA-binding FrmR family transcriptional regulator
VKRYLDPEGRVRLERDAAERDPLLKRLRRVEGQIRGLIEMIQADRYCGEELQQLAAARAALSEIAVLLTAQHLGAAASYAIESGNKDAAMADIEAVLRAALRKG